MYLALKEMRRAKARFGLLMAAVGLLVFLILFQQTLQNGLIDAFIGAIRNQSAPVLVFGVDGRRNLQGSVITPELQSQIRAVDGVGRAGSIGERSLPATAGGRLTQVSMIGYEVEGLGSPSRIVAGRLPAATGEVVASDVDKASGFAIGEKVRIEPGGGELTVVGLAADAQLLVAPTLYGSYETYSQAIRSFNPDAATPLPSVIGLEPVTGVSPEQLAQRVAADVADADALTRSEAAAATPGVGQIQQSFRIIFLLYAMVVPFVTGLFFLIITFQKADALTLLRAVGAPASRLVGSLMIQVLIVIIGGLGIGTALYSPLASRRLGTIALQFQTGALVFWSALLLILGVLSALFSAQRVLKIEPMAATTGSGVGR